MGRDERCGAARNRGARSQELLRWAAETSAVVVAAGVLVRVALAASDAWFGPGRWTERYYVLVATLTGVILVGGTVWCWRRHRRRVQTGGREDRARP